jgi:hypothetical protein
MKRILAIIALATIACLMAGSAIAQVDPATIKRAADAVPQIQDRMRDPDSFKLEGVFITSTPVIVCETWTCRKKQRPLVTSTCFSFRAHNAYGGYGDGGFAVLRESGVIGVLTESNGGLHTGHYDLGAKVSLTKKGEPVEPCQSRYISADITAEVKAELEPKPAPAATPAEQAERAQQRADCFKMAMNNPSIVCK